MPALLRRIAAFLALVILLHPFFFVIFRLMAFETLPRDSYEAYLLWIAGAPGGELPGSPFGYRLFSVVMAWPIFSVLPPIRLSQMAAVDEFQLRATGAMAALSYLTTLAASVTAYAIAVDKCRLSRLKGVVAGALMFALVWYTGIATLDPITILVIAVGIYVVDRPWLFAALMLVSVGINEKVGFVLGAWLVARWLFVPTDRPRLGVQAATTVAALGIYVALVALIRLPGNEYQLDPARYLATAAENIAAYATPRGVMLNVVPTVVLAAIALLSWRFAGRRTAEALFRPIDALAIPALLLAALILTHLYQGGRIAMLTAPLFVVPAAAAIGGWSRRGAKTGGAAALSDDGASHSPVGL